MDSSFSARGEVLRSIRLALGQRMEAERVAAQYDALPRDYKRAGTLSQEDKLQLFLRRLEEYGAGVKFVARDAIREEIGGKLAARGCRRLVIPRDLPAAWLPLGFEFIPNGGEGELSPPLGAAEMDGMDGALTGCTVAVAETGSIVLQSGPRQGSRALTLVPDYHLCVVFAGQVVETVPESFAVLDSTSDLPTTFFSGPSATADIEMTRIKGVHGPRFLDVLVVE